jgi:hypothetical protein
VRTRNGRTFGNKLETPCRDERSMSPGPKGPPLDYFVGERPARSGYAAASGNMGNFPILFQPVFPLHN